jgi:transcriptional regulator with XRE-family HTH domain
MKNTIGERIRKCRVNKGLSQEYVANELNLSTSAYSNIETDKTDVTAKRLITIAEILDVNVNVLMGTENIVQNYTSAEPSVNNILESEMKQLKLQIKQMQSVIQEIQKKNNKKK